MKKRSVIQRAIHGAWCSARAAGIEPTVASGNRTGVMTTNQKIRHAMVRAWLAGFRQGKNERMAKR